MIKTQMKGGPDDIPNGFDIIKNREEKDKFSMVTFDGFLNMSIPSPFDHLEAWEIGQVLGGN